MIYNNQFNYENIIYTTFSGGSSVQAQELNELQEQLINQITQYNNLIGNQYSNITESNSFMPVDLRSITTNQDLDGLPTQLIKNGWYLYKFNSMTYFIKLPEIEYYGVNGSFERYIVPKLGSRQISARSPDWDILRDTTEETLDSIGSGRIQIQIKEDYISSTQPTITQAQTVTDYEVWALHWPTAYPRDIFFKRSLSAIDYYSAGVTGHLEIGIGATFGSTFTDEDGNVIYRFKFLSLAPSMQAPPSTDGGWNGWNAPGDGYTYDSTGVGQYSWDYFKQNIKKVPESRRAIEARPWEGGNIFGARWGYYDYYKNTTDGTIYEGLRFNTPWSDVAATDTQISVKKFLTACKTDDLKFSYFITDQEQPVIPWHFRRGFHQYNNNGATAHEQPNFPFTKSSDIKSDIRFISAIINDPRFRQKTLNDETGSTTKTLFGFYSEAFTALKTKYETLTGNLINLSVEDSLLPFTNLIDADPSVIAPSTFWTPYGGESFDYRGTNIIPMGYEYQHIVFPSLDYMLDNIAWNNYHKKAFVDVFKELGTTNLNVFQDVTSIQSHIYKINESESPFIRDGNDNPYYTNASRGNLKNNHQSPVYYNLAQNSMFATYLDLTPGTIRLDSNGRFDPVNGTLNYLDDRKYIINNRFKQFWPTRSGYIKGSTFDLEKYSFQGNLVGPTFYNQGGILVGCSGCQLPTELSLIRYPETFPDTPNNTEKFYLELAFKIFTHEMIHVRSTHRSDPLLYQKYSPIITGFASSPNPNQQLMRVYSHNKYTKLYWKEFVWQLLMHGVNFFQYWDFAYTANLGLWDLHLILDQWRTSTGNSRVRPCNKFGVVSGSYDNAIVDRLLLEDMYENCIISGGKIISGPMKDRYIWRISVPPKFISWNADQSFGEVVGTLTVSGSDPVVKKLAVIGDGDIRPQSGFVLRSWGPCPSGVPCPPDFNGDGTVTAADSAEFSSKYDGENRLGFTVINPPNIKNAPTFVPEIPS